MFPFATREIHIQQHLDVPKARVLSYVRDPDTVLRTNPFLTSFVGDAANEAAGPDGVQWFTVTDKVPLIGGLTTSTSFRVQWKNVQDGVDIEVYASAGTRLTTRLRVVDAAGGGAEYSDHVTVQGIFLFTSFVVSKAERSHGALRDRIAEKSKQSRT